MSKVKELQYPDECARCKADACSICGHRQKRADAIDKYKRQFKSIKIQTYNPLTQTLDDYCKKTKCPHYIKGKDCEIDNCYIRDGEMDDNYYRGD